jgi:DNA-binding SARP family transcriptional activator
LLLQANEPVHHDVLAERLWGEHPPSAAHNTLAVYVSRLRRLLETTGDGKLLVTRSGAYLLRVGTDQLDVHRFESLVKKGRDALAAKQPHEATALLSDALALWRGPALAELRYESFALSAIRRLEELRIGVTEDRIDADLALGRHALVISELEGLMALHPLRERLQHQLMIALYRCGRQADALAAYQSVRRALVAELGIEPNPGLQRLQADMLTQDPSLHLDHRWW